jgi:hypothetical protein
LSALQQIRDTTAHRVDVKVSYRGDPWSTVQFEASPVEGLAGHHIQWANNAFIDLKRVGLRPSGDLPVVTIAYLIAQKLHACTDHADSEQPNDRYRDLIDLILVDQLTTKNDYLDIRDVCVEIFRLRDKHPWPPCVTVLPEWPEGYRRLAERIGFAPSDVNLAARAVEDIIRRIDTSLPTG